MVKMQNVAQGSAADNPKLEKVNVHHDIGTSSTPCSATSSPAKSETETYSEHPRFMTDSSESEEDSVSEVSALNSQIMHFIRPRRGPFRSTCERHLVVCTDRPYIHTMPVREFSFVPTRGFPLISHYLSHFPNAPQLIYK